ncbi:MAG TPA: MFS transporter, partial [Gaiellaceae bacterium]|nr:MFS transporter [Gaiellaceae bacterium]
MTLLRNRSLLALVGAQIVSGLGSRMTFLALPWFVLATTGSAAKMGVVLAVEMAPVALLGIPSGAVVARLGALRAMQVSDLARVPLMASLPVLHALGLLSFPLLLAIVFLIGCFVAPFFAAQRVVLAELVGDEDPALLAQANAVVEGGNTITSLLGPALAGILIALVGPTNLLYVDAATFAVSFLTLTLFVPRRPPVAQSDDARGLFAGLRFFGRDPLLWRIASTLVCINFFGAALSISLPVLAYVEYGQSPRLAGLFFAAFGGGALVGTLLAVRILPRFQPLRLAAVAILALVLPLWLLGLDVPAWAVVLALFVSAVPQPLVNAPIVSLITAKAPAAITRNTGRGPSASRSGPARRIPSGPASIASVIIAVIT